MPPKQSSSLERLKQDRRQVRRTFTETYNEVTGILVKPSYTAEEISQLRFTNEELNAKFKDCRDLDKDIRKMAMDEIKDEAELDASFDEVDEVTSANRGKLRKIQFYISEYDTKNAKPAIVSSIPMLSPAPTVRSKLPDLQLPTFDGQITEWSGFWERFQSEVGTLPDLPKSSKSTYLIGQLRGEALKTIQGIIPSEQNYAVLEETLRDNFGQTCRIIRAHVCNILKLPKPCQSPPSLRQFYNSLMGDLRSLEALGIDISVCAPFIIPIVEEKLPGKVRSSIGDSRQGVHFALQLFTNGLKAYITREEKMQIGIHPTSQQPSSRYDTYEHQFTSTLSTTVQTRCQLCKGAQASSHCTLPANEKAAAAIHLKLCLNCLNPGHRVANCTAKGRCAKCKSKHHTSIHGICVHPNASNATPQHQTPTSSQPPSRTNINANITSCDASNASSPADAGTTCDSSSKSTMMNCAPVLDNYAISIQSHAYLPIDMKSSNEVSNVTRAKNFVDSVATIASSNGQQNSLKPKDDVILLKTANSVVVVNGKALIGNIFFDKGSQRSSVAKLEVLPVLPSRTKIFQ